jgi:hypothetical protein
MFCILGIGTSKWRRNSRWTPYTNVNLLSKSFETLDLKTSIHKKKIVEVTFFQNFKMEEKFKMAQLLFYTFGSCTVISQPISTYKHILVLQNLALQKRVNIQDPSVRLSLLFSPFSNLCNLQIFRFSIL